MDKRPACSGECASRRAFIHEAVRAALAVGWGALVVPTAVSALTVGHTGLIRYPVPPRDGVSIDSRNEVILCRVTNRVYAFSLACPHQNTALRALGGTKGFQCPRHKSRYQPDGTFISGKATRNMDRLPITRDGNAVEVNPAFAYASDAEPGLWAAAVVILEAA